MVSVGGHEGGLVAVADVAVLGIDDVGQVTAGAATVGTVTVIMR